MKILVVSDLVDIKNKKITHFSLDKGLNLGIGIKNNGHNVDYVVNIDDYTEDDINYKDYKKLTYELIDEYDYTIIVREAIIPEILEQFIELKKIFFSRERKTKIIVKSDSSNWVIEKNFRKYIGDELKTNSSQHNITRCINKLIDVICVQNEEMCNLAVHSGLLRNKILITNMSVPIEPISYKDIENPYKEDYSYCKPKKQQYAGSAFYPLYYEKNPTKIKELIGKQRKKIIYMGRIKTDSGKIIFLIRDIIQKLGDDYELHIFPGSFFIYNNDENKFDICSANNANHLELLRDTIFPDDKNVFIHTPFEHSHIKKYLWHADLGIDFSSSRPNDVKTLAGNAKLLEYCYMGLPVVSEENVNNSWLVTNANNGILLKGIGTVDDYVEAIKKLETMQIDRKKASEITIANENWNLRAKKMLEDLEKMK